MNEVYEEIKAKPSAFDPSGEGKEGKERGQILTTPGNADKTEYTVKSRGDPPQEMKIKMQADTAGNITSGKIEGFDTSFTDIKELLRTANLVNKLKQQYSVTTPIHLKKPTDEAFYRTSSYGLF